MRRKPKHQILSLLLVWTFFLQIAQGCASSASNLKRLPRADRKGLAVLNFHNTSPRKTFAEFQPWQFGIPAMLMTDIESIGLFNIVSRDRLKDIIEEQVFQTSGLVDPQTVVRMGKLVAASYILTGSYSVVNNQLRIETHVFSVESGVQLGAAEVTGATASFFKLEKELVLKISHYLQAMLSEEDQGRITGNIETASVQASLNNYAGEMELTEARALRGHGKIQEAIAAEKTAAEKFQQALHFDPGYGRARENLRNVMMGMPMTL